MNCQDIANDLATAVKWRNIEQMAFAGYLMGLKSNNIEARPELLQPYADALTVWNEKLNRVLWDAFNAGCIKKRPGKVPKISFNADKKCDNRCMNATGMECECICFGANHGINNLHL